MSCKAGKRAISGDLYYPRGSVHDCGLLTYTEKRSTAMKIGLIPINIRMESLENLVGLAQFVESRGFESVWTFEHVMVPVEYESKYPYNKEGKMGGGSDNPFLDPLIALTAVAADGQDRRPVHREEKRGPVEEHDR